MPTTVDDQDDKYHEEYKDYNYKGDTDWYPFGRYNKCCMVAKWLGRGTDKIGAQDSKQTGPPPPSPPSMSLHLSLCPNIHGRL